MQLRAEGMAMKYAEEHGGYSRPPYGQRFPVCGGHCYPVTLKQSWTERNPGRWFAMCNVAHANKPDGPKRQCSSWFWVAEAKAAAAAAAAAK